MHIHSLQAMLTSKHPETKLEAKSKQSNNHPLINFTQQIIWITFLQAVPVLLSNSNALSILIQTEVRSKSK